MGKNADKTKAAYPSEKEFQAVAARVSAVSIAANVLLSAVKFLAGVVAGSGAMISDAVHSVSDVFSTVVVMIGVRMAGRESDKEHPYGHERLECVAAVILSAVLFATGLAIGVSACGKIFAGGYAHLKAPGARGGRAFDCVKRSHVLVYEDKRAADRFRRTDGGRLAPPLRFAFVCRRINRDCRSKAWVSGARSNCKYGYLPVYRQGGI